MNKSKKIFKCQECGHEVSHWMGTCPKCKNFGTIQEVEASITNLEKVGLKSSTAIKPTKKASTISELNKTPATKFKTNIKELDRVLGGGFIAGEVVLFSGAPGAGKSSLSLRIAEKFANQNKTILYSSGEESEDQIGLRALRMNINNENIKIINETNLESLLGYIEEEKPDLLIVDSLQTIASTGIPGSIGSLQQSSEAANTLTRLAKKQNIIMILISQITKSGDFSGSESIQHIVDCSLMLDSDENTPLKFLRTTKNRFGSTNEVGVFQHEETGLEEVADPSSIFIETDDDNTIGASCSFISEGIRQIPVEIQALVTVSTLTNPRKQFNGINFQRGQIVCAILDKFCQTQFFNRDVFISTVSGIKIIDPQADLSIAASLYSSFSNIPIPNDHCFIGEMSLTGQVRGSFMINNKIKEAIRLGFKTITIPYNSQYDKKILNNNDIKIINIKNIKEITKTLRK